MKTAVDSNVLFDLRLRDPVFGEACRDALAEAFHEGPVVVCAVVYAELAAGFDNPADVDVFLHDLAIQLDPFEPAALQQAGHVWKAYARGRDPRVQCRYCGRTFAVACPSCQNRVSWRQHLIPDILIGAHALVRADQLLTRDRGYYQMYFPNLRLNVPVPS